MNSVLSRKVRPYSRFATVYDETLGRAAFHRFRRPFEKLIRRYGIHFRSAADLGCGTGLFACWLSRRWQIPVFAVDQSPEMLRVATRNCAGADVLLLRQDIRCLRLPRPVELITANFDTINHLTGNADLLAAFKSIRDNLCPGGYFYFDLVTPCRPLDGHRVFIRRLRTISREMIQQIRWEPRRRILSGHILVLSSGTPRVIVEEHRERAYTLAEVGRWLMEAGFAIRGVHDEATLRHASVCPPRAIVIAR